MPDRLEQIRPFQFGIREAIMQNLCSSKQMATHAATLMNECSSSKRANDTFVTVKAVFIWPTTSVRRCDFECECVCVCASEVNRTQPVGSSPICFLLHYGPLVQGCQLNTIQARIQTVVTANQNNRGLGRRRKPDHWTGGQTGKQMKVAI